MRSSKYTEHYTDTFITFKEIMRTVSKTYTTIVYQIRLKTEEILIN
jgi:hypothetical protein